MRHRFRALACAVLLTASVSAQLPDGSFIVSTFGWAGGSWQTSGHGLWSVDTFSGVSTQLTVAGFPSVPNEIPNKLLFESPTSFLLGTWIPGPVATNLVSGRIHRITWSNGAWSATRLDTGTIPAGIGGIARIGNELWFTTVPRFDLGVPAGSTVWRMPAGGGAPTMAVDLTALGATGTGAPAIARGTDLHVFTFVSGQGSAPGEHWVLDTAANPVTASRVGALPTATRAGVVGNNFGCLAADWDEREQAFVLLSVFGELLWRTPAGQNVRRRPIEVAVDPNSTSSFTSGIAVDRSTGAVVFGDRLHHLEDLRCPDGAFRLDHVNIPGAFFVSVVSVAHVPAAPRYVFDGPLGCDLSNGTRPCSSVNSLPRVSNAMFALTLETSATQAILMFGIGNTSWAGQPLPFDLMALGAPGCALGIAPEVAVVVTGPDPSFAIALPSQPSTLYVQWAVLDSVNALGLALSESRRIEIR